MPPQTELLAAGDKRAPQFGLSGSARSPLSLREGVCVAMNGQAFLHMESRLWWIAAEMRRPSDELCEKSLYASNDSIDKTGPLCDILRDITGLTVLP